MKNIILKNEELDIEIELNICDNWNEVSLREYFKLIDLSNRRSDIDDMEFTIEMISVLSKVDKNILMNIPISEFTILEDLIKGLNPESLSNSIKESIIIDGITYIPKKNMGNITTNEMIWIKNIEKSSKTYSENILGKLVVLLRPGYEKKLESGDLKWIQKPYDNDEFESRKELFLDKLSPSDAIPLINFFLNGKKG